MDELQHALADAEATLAERHAEHARHQAAVDAAEGDYRADPTNEAWELVHECRKWRDKAAFDRDAAAQAVAAARGALAAAERAALEQACDDALARARHASWREHVAPVLARLAELDAEVLRASEALCAAAVDQHAAVDAAAALCARLGRPPPVEVRSWQARVEPRHLAAAVHAALSPGRLAHGVSAAAREVFGSAATWLDLAATIRAPIHPGEVSREQGTAAFAQAAARAVA